MNSPHRLTRFEAVPALPLPDGTVLHRSSRTSLAVNPTSPGRFNTAVMTSQLKLFVEHGALRIECTGRRLEVESTEPAAHARRRARHVRGSL
jgi:hypothetical protein